MSDVQFHIMELAFMSLKFEKVSYEGLEEHGRSNSTPVMVSLAESILTMRDDLCGCAP
jgi:hypothetical protein